MKCPVCKSELTPPYRFCAGCGNKVEDRNDDSIKETLLEIEDDSCMELPEELKTDLDKLRVLVQTSQKNDNRGKNKQMYVATRSGDIDIACDLSELDDISLFTTGNVKITHTETFHKAIFTYFPRVSEERTIFREIGFKEFLILRREVDEYNENHITIYTDYCTKDIEKPILSDTEMRFISRKAIYVLYRKNKFYIYCSNPKPGYIEIDRVSIPNSRIKAISMGSDVIISGAYGLRLCLQ